MYGHRKRVCTESWLWEKNPFPHRGIELASAACRSDALPTELHPHRVSDKSNRVADEAGDGRHDKGCGDEVLLGTSERLRISWLYSFIHLSIYVFFFFLYVFLHLVTVFYLFSFAGGGKVGEGTINGWNGPFVADGYDDNGSSNDVALVLASKRFPVTDKSFLRCHCLPCSCVPQPFACWRDEGIHAGRSHVILVLSC